MRIPLPRVNEMTERDVEQSAGTAFSGPDIRAKVEELLKDEAHLRAKALTEGPQIPNRRKATPEDIVRLTGTSQFPDVPYGLERCGYCGKWQGECLSRGDQVGRYVVYVKCICHKQLRCEVCGRLRFESLPGLPASNYYNEELRRVVRISTLAQLVEHRCRGAATGPAYLKRGSGDEKLLSAPGRALGYNRDKEGATGAGTHTEVPRVNDAPASQRAARAEARAMDLYPDDPASRLTFLQGVLYSWEAETGVG